MGRARECSAHCFIAFRRIAWINILDGQVTSGVGGLLWHRSNFCRDTSPPQTGHLRRKFLTVFNQTTDMT